MSKPIDIACEHIASGHVIAYPTESVYGLGCDPSNTQAIENLLHLKQRSPDKGLIIVAASLEQFSPYIKELTKAQEELILSDSSTVTTWLVPAQVHITSLLCGIPTEQDKKIAIRVSQHPTIQAICSTLNHPMVSTSANISGQDMCYSVDEIKRQFNNKIDYILEGKLGSKVKPSQIIDLASMKILRE